MADTLGDLLAAMAQVQTRTRPDSYLSDRYATVAGHPVHPDPVGWPEALRAVGDAIEGRVLRLVAELLAVRVSPDPEVRALASDCADDPLDPTAVGLLADWLEDRRFPVEDVARVRSLALRSGDLLVLTPGSGRLSREATGRLRDSMTGLLEQIEARHGVRCECLVLPDSGMRLDLLRVARGGAAKGDA